MTVCYPSDTALCWVCGKAECPNPEPIETKQLALFEVLPTPKKKRKR